MQFIESRYAINELVTATPQRRVASYAIEWGLGLLGVFPHAFLDPAPAALLAAPFVLAYLVWFVRAARKGQTPGKQLLRMYILRSDGHRAGAWFVAFRELVVIGLGFGLFAALIEWLLGIRSVEIGTDPGVRLIGAAQILMLLALLWLVLDRDRQALWDKVARTYVAYSPGGYRPKTGNELRQPAASAPRSTRG